MPTGTVKWFNTTKGYGFIAPDGGGKDVFVHISAVERSGLTGLADNQKVGFELQEGRDGRQMAADLKLKLEEARTRASKNRRWGNNVAPMMAMTPANPPATIASSCLAPWLTPRASNSAIGVSKPTR